jgi:DNA adenine methylase
MAGDVNAWWTAIAMLPEIIDRIRRGQILCRPALEAIARYDHEDALVYCDPPYVHATREQNSRDVYHGELSDEDHVRLAELLNRCKSKVVVSGYPSDLYDGLYAGWRRVEFEIANHAAGGRQKGRETECLWLNY